ncbi:hypothetical protein PanWU01x14_283800 [Parasponia andersonii]|uniref:Uncharacterized protein n=1 Tax=Parasponia andersonii TaxID=3476 RepID=A0A2P5B077_PARAD|nr:hypothetical protein PanWU01x14_283800 [Parasponia andersonii]
MVPRLPPSLLTGALTSTSIIDRSSGCYLHFRSELRLISSSLFDREVQFLVPLSICFRLQLGLRIFEPRGFHNRSMISVHGEVRHNQPQVAMVGSSGALVYFTFKGFDSIEGAK